MPKITNNSQALQGVNALSGVVYLAPGESRDLELNEGEMAALKRLPFIGVQGDHAAPAPEPIDATDRADIKRQATELSIEFPRNITTEKLKELIDAKLAA